MVSLWRFVETNRDKINSSLWAPSVSALCVRKGHQQGPYHRAGCAGLSSWGGWGKRILVPGIGPICTAHAATVADHHRCPGLGPMRQVGSGGERDTGSHVHSEVFFAKLISCWCSINPVMSVSVSLVILPGLRHKNQEQGQHWGHTAQGAPASLTPAKGSQNHRRGPPLGWQWWQCWGQPETLISLLFLSPEHSSKQPPHSRVSITSCFELFLEMAPSFWVTSSSHFASTLSPSVKQGCG